MKHRWIIAAAMAALGAAFSVTSSAQGAGVPFAPGWDSQLSKPTFKVRVLHNVRVPMHDGITLSADIYLPTTEGRYPTLLVRTPYNNNASDEIADAVWYAERGYVFVNQDVRGRYDSDGKFYLYRNEASDGDDTDAWIAEQPWSNGKIGTLSGSYPGYTSVTQGLRANPHLGSVATEVTTVNIHNDWAYTDGAFELAFALGWGAAELNGRNNQNGEPVDDWAKFYRHLPLITADEAAGYTNEAYRDWLRHPLRGDAYWTGISYENQVQNVEVPVSVSEGWYDVFLRGALEDDAVIRAHAATQVAREHKRLIIGPWTHFKGRTSRINTNSRTPVTTGPDREVDFGPDAQIDMRNWYLLWHDHWLKGIDNGVDRLPPLSLFVMGINKWRYENEWPLARTKWTRYYIGSSGHANSAKGDGTLDTHTPRHATTDTYDYNPDNPVPTLGGNVCCAATAQGPHNQAKAEARDDVLVYTTPELTQAIEVTGPIKMTLYASSSAKDTDWTAKLVDVYPDGYAQNIQDGIIRARYRGGVNVFPSLLQPGQVYEYSIDMWATSNVFLPGHRIRIEISSSDFPRFDRNLNTGEDPATGTRMEIAHQTIYHSAKYPSYVMLPVIPAGREHLAKQ